MASVMTDEEATKKAAEMADSFRRAHEAAKPEIDQSRTEINDTLAGLSPRERLLLYQLVESHEANGRCFMAVADWLDCLPREDVFEEIRGELEAIRKRIGRLETVLVEMAPGPNRFLMKVAESIRQANCEFFGDGWKPDSFIQIRDQQKATRARWVSICEKKGVKVFSGNSVLLECKRCGQRWSPDLLSGGRLPRGYWKCPKGCNH